MTLVEPPVSRPRPFWKTTLRALVRILAAAIDLYALATIIYLLLRLLLGERFWPVALLNSLMPLPLLPAVSALLVQLAFWLARIVRVWHAALLLPAALAFIVLYGGLFVPRARTAPEGASTFMLLSFNVQSQMGNSDDIAAFLLSSGADVIALQELTQTLADQLIPQLTATYPHQALHPSDAFAFGMGVFSRFPILEEAMLELSFYNQRVRIALDDDTAMTLFNVHPPPPLFRGGFDATVRGQDIASIVEWASAETGAVILTGDWNSTDQSDHYGLVAAHYRDSFREVGWGLGATWPNFHYATYPGSQLVAGILPPLIRIDHIFHSDEVQALEAGPLSESAGSDHFPMLARLAVP
jgi:vancomycin resistance protein VanJ